MRAFVVIHIGYWPSVRSRWLDIGFYWTMGKMGHLILWCSQSGQRICFIALSWIYPYKKETYSITSFNKTGEKNNIAITLRRKLWTFKYNCKWCYIGIWGNRNRFSWKYINIYLSLSQNIGNVFPICSLKRWFSFCPNIYILSVGFLECWLSDGFPQLSDIRQ